MRKRLEGLEILAVGPAGRQAERTTGRDLRGVATEEGIDCWPEAEDGRWREWAREQASPELRELLGIFHDAVTRRAEELGMSVTDEQRFNPWRDDEGAA